MENFILGKIRKYKRGYAENFRYFTILADHYVRIGKFKNAENLLLDNIEKYSYYNTQYVVLAELYTEQERYQEAKEILNKALGFNPNHPKLLRLLADAELMSGDKDKYNELMSRVAKIEPLNKSLDKFRETDSDNAFDSLEGKTPDPSEVEQLGIKNISLTPSKSIEEYEDEPEEDGTGGIPNISLSRNFSSEENEEETSDLPQEEGLVRGSGEEVQDSTIIDDDEETEEVEEDKAEEIPQVAPLNFASVDEFVEPKDIEEDNKDEFIGKSPVTYTPEDEEETEEGEEEFYSAETRSSASPLERQSYEGYSDTSEDGSNLDDITKNISNEIEDKTTEEEPKEEADEFSNGLNIQMVDEENVIDEPKEDVVEEEAPEKEVVDYQAESELQELKEELGSESSDEIEDISPESQDDDFDIEKINFQNMDENEKALFENKDEPEDFGNSFDNVEKELSFTTMKKEVPTQKEDKKEKSEGSNIKISTNTLAEIYSSQGEYRKAKEVYKELLKQDPENKEYKEKYIRAEYNLTKARIEDEMEYYEEMISKYPDNQKYKTKYDKYKSELNDLNEYLNKELGDK